MTKGFDAERLQTADTQCTIDDYAVIGDCRSAALISRTGSIDWLCWPRFDSPSFFARLIDQNKGGFWQICPAEPFRSTRSYLAETNVLETRFENASGILQVTDFMPIAHEVYKRANFFPDQELVRILTCLGGEMEVLVKIEPRPEYGTTAAIIVDKAKLGLRMEGGVGMLALHHRLDFTVMDGVAVSKVTLKEGDQIPLILTFSLESPQVLPLLEEAPAALQRTVRWWREWVGVCTYRGRYVEQVRRSLLTLKLMEFSASGAFVAAVTTSLPEKIGGGLNWDYRYCWLRDASLTIQALCDTGFVAEAEAFSEWMLHATRLTQPKLLIMYDVYGNPVAAEKRLAHLAGYQNSQPVQIGNEAKDQIQLDTYGEVICGAARVIHITGAVDRETAKVLIGFGKYVCKHWKEPDAGIWEPRDEPVVHTHSRLLCWVALHELIGLHDKGILGIRNITSFRSTRDRMRAELETHCWNEDLQSYTSGPDSTAMDATLLLMAWHNFHEPESCCLTETYKRISEKLDAGGCLLYRYRNTAEPEEGAFGICSFWAAEYLAMGGGSLEEATDRFEKLLSYANDVGLYSEEIDPDSGCALGNFPQAFTHVGLINAALALERREQKQHTLDSLQTDPMEQMQ